MTSKTSTQLKAELTSLFYGIDPLTLEVGGVTASRGGMLTLRRDGKPPSSYRIRGGRPAQAEVVRVFGLTDLITLAPADDIAAGAADHPLVASLKLIAAEQRRTRDAYCVRLSAAVADGLEAPPSVPKFSTTRPGATRP
jgi:hypothetical protein